MVLQCGKLKSRKEVNNMSFSLLNVFLQTNNDERVEVLFRYYNGVSGGRISVECYGSVDDGGRVSAILQGYSVANTDIKYNPVKKDDLHKFISEFPKGTYDQNITFIDWMIAKENKNERYLKICNKYGRGIIKWYLLNNIIQEFEFKNFELFTDFKGRVCSITVCESKFIISYIHNFGKEDAKLSQTQKFSFENIQNITIDYDENRHPTIYIRLKNDQFTYYGENGVISLFFPQIKESISGASVYKKITKPFSDWELVSR